MTEVPIKLCFHLQNTPAILANLICYFPTLLCTHRVQISPVGFGFGACWQMLMCCPSKEVAPQRQQNSWCSWSEATKGQNKFWVKGTETREKIWKEFSDVYVCVAAALFAQTLNTMEARLYAAFLHSHWIKKWWFQYLILHSMLEFHV